MPRLLLLFAIAVLDGITPSPRRAADAPTPCVGVAHARSAVQHDDAAGNDLLDDHADDRDRDERHDGAHPAPAVVPPEAPRGTVGCADAEPPARSSGDRLGRLARGPPTSIEQPPPR